MRKKYGDWSQQTPFTDTDLATIASYDYHCLKQEILLSSRQGEEVATFLNSRVGVILHAKQNGSLGGVIPHCVATLMDDRTILTARHCAFAKSTGEQISNELIDDGNLAFALPDPHSNVVRVAQFSESVGSPSYGSKAYMDYREDTEDFILMRLQDAPYRTQKVSKLRIASPKIYDQLITFGMNINALLPQILKDKKTAIDWKSAIRFDDMPSCSIALFINEFCIAHACQTESGNSGTPLFRIGKDKNLELVGVHTRSWESIGYGACKHARTDAIPNLGVHPHGPAVTP